MPITVQKNSIISASRFINSARLVGIEGPHAETFISLIMVEILTLDMLTNVHNILLIGQLFSLCLLGYCIF